MNARHKWVASRALAPAIALLALTACTSNTPEDATSVSVDIAAASCVLSASSATAGPVVFTVKNTGDAVAEFYVYAGDGTEIVAEVENVGPGLSRDLVVTLDVGTYVTSCDAGMNGDDIRADFVATAAGETAAA